MQVFALLPLLASFFAVSPAAAAAVAPDMYSVVTEPFMGRSSEIKMLVTRCGASLNTRAEVPNNATACATSCSVSQCDSPAAGNPNKDDCAHLAEALINEADAAPYIITSPAGAVGDTITVTYGTCKSSFINHANANTVYCRRNWGNIIGGMTGDSTNCGAATCEAADNVFAIQVTHV